MADDSASAARATTQWITVFAITVLGIMSVVVYAALAYVQIAVLNPSAAVPDTPVDQIWAEVEASQGATLTGTAPILIAGPVLAVVVGIAAMIALRRVPLAAASAYLVMMIGGAPAYFAASFGPGMNLADTYDISGAAYSPWGLVLYLVSAVAVVALVAVSGAAAFFRRRATAA